MAVKSFAAFIMTYERPQEVLHTIQKLLAQTFSPEKILVVDNSLKEDTKLIVSQIEDPRIEYHRMGFNAGPAGAAHAGLTILTSYGYEWIFWGDDDDPPSSTDSFKNIFEMIQSNLDDRIGVVGELGGKLNRKTGRTLNFQNYELKGIVEADYIPGNKLMLVHSDVIKHGLLPTEKLFFGFEELDFCMKVKKSGYKILFDGNALLAHRVNTGKTDASYRWRGKSIGDIGKLWRQYYSTRNMLYILKTNKLWFAVVYNLFRAVAKSIYGFRFGWNYGFKHFRIQWLSIIDFVRGRFGKIDLSSFLQ